MTTLLIIMFIVLLLAIGAVIYLLITKNNGISSDTLGMVKQDIQGISQLINQSQSHLNDRIDKNNSAMQQSVQKQMTESHKIIADVTERLTKLDETNKRVVDFVVDVSYSIEYALTHVTTFTVAKLDGLERPGGCA